MTIEFASKEEYNKLSERVSTLEGTNTCLLESSRFAKEKMDDFCKGQSRMSEKVTRIETILETLPDSVANKIYLNMYKNGNSFVNGAIEGRLGKWAIGAVGLAAGAVIMKIATPIWDLILTVPK